MRTFFKALAGAVLAASAALSSAQPVTLNFEDLLVSPVPPNPQAGVLGTYMGFDFSNANGTEDPATPGVPGMWYWQASNGPYSGSPSPLVNITGYHQTPSNDLNAFTFSHAGALPFTLQSLWVCCGPVYLELVDTADNIHYLGGWDGNNVWGNGISTHPVTGDPVASTVFLTPPEVQNLPLKEVAVWSFPNQFAIDDIHVTVVPEPSAYLMAMVGVGLLVAARRRKSAQQNA